MKGRNRENKINNNLLGASSVSIKLNDENDELDQFQVADNDFKRGSKMIEDCSRIFNILKCFSLVCPPSLLGENVINSQIAIGLEFPKHLYKTESNKTFSIRFWWKINQERNPRYVKTFSFTSIYFFNDLIAFDTARQNLNSFLLFLYRTPQSLTSARVRDETHFIAKFS
jgi:hypothetical protein